MYSIENIEYRMFYFMKEYSWNSDDLINKKMHNKSLKSASFYINVLVFIYSFIEKF